MVEEDLSPDAGKTNMPLFGSKQINYFPLIDFRSDLCVAMCKPRVEDVLFQEVGELGNIFSGAHDSHE
jgi:hypothetical protein